jgi:PhoPQ-activated pathogenicity-related protein
MHWKRKRNAVVTVTLTLCTLAIPRLLLSAEGLTALDRYVHQPDPTYAWNVASTVEHPGAKTLIVRLKSQTWRTPQEVDRPVWEHWLVVVRPEKPVSDTAFLFIGGGSNRSDMPSGPDEKVAQIARATNTVVAELRMVPNQPLVFNNDGQPRSEDDLIAYTADKFLRTGDETWPARLPMVKSAVRAMDCVQELMAGKEGGHFAINHFVVAGGSKRGWTTWMTGAVDKRVRAIVPIVIDVVNVDPSMRHHVAAYGFWAEAIGDYVQHEITKRWDHPRLRDLYHIEDPYYYRHRLTMPKLIVNAAGDEFFLPDSSQFYFADLEGEKHLRYVANGNHSLRDTDALESIVAFYQMILSDTPRPEFSWKFEDDGSIRVSAVQKPRQVQLWQATNPDARDFRVKTIGRTYQKQSLEDQGNGTFIGKVDEPDKGWVAFFVELVYDGPTPVPLKLTTPVRVLPDTLPFANINPGAAPYELEARQR